MELDSINFIEFEFWFQRFSAGNFDLDYDRRCLSVCRKDPKYRTITDMPVDVFQKICENLGEDYQEDYRFVFRHVCKSFRALADSWIPTFTEISIKSKSDAIIVKFDDEEIEYTDGNRAISDLTSILAYPDLKFHEFEFNSNLDKRFLERLVLKLKSLKLKIHVAYFHLNSDNWEYHKRLLPFYRAETVGTVSIYGSQTWVSEFIEKIALKSKNKLFSNMELNVHSLHVKEATKIIKNLLQFSKLEYCYLDVDSRSNFQLKKNIERLGAKIQGFRSDIFHYPILYSTDFFEIKFDCEGIFIERKSKST
ncbi:Protein CBG18558 [Caenorhabditis briggsae]|uniref:Protein CBG18558 n=1 Tax=Caenorhabditis briggsae TaxID=6238 RepID=A8XTK6_CAEBR|nr:Protein CBG18558 [Caenorhabditis briggsae]CAP35983.2 Protein CBG18558 [Caenorhabditis briggsae]